MVFETWQLIFGILILFIMIYSLVNRICNSFEECAKLKALGDAVSKISADKLENILKKES